MYNLIPHFIHDQYRAGQLTGHFTAATIFLDVKGFTQMTNQLMKHGREGAEVLSYAMRNIFEPVIHAVYQRDGFIVTFAGDAFTAVFPLPPEFSPTQRTQRIWQASFAAQTIQEALLENEIQETRFGVFELQGKIGLSFGPVDWGIVGPADHKTYFFRGPAIDGCANGEGFCGPGEIVLDRTLYHHLPTESLKLDPVNDDYALLRAITVTETAPLIDLPPPMTLETATTFIPERLLNARQVGEFRTAVDVFISFAGVDNLSELNRLASTTISGVDEFGGYFNRLDFGDKGGNMLIFFGAPVAYENNLDRALNFVLSLRQQLHALTEAGDLPNLRWRAGITEGISYSGMSGIPLRCEYTTFGNAINLSARLMMQADWGQFLVPPNVAQNPRFSFEHLGDFQYKGLPEPMPTFELEGKRLDAAQTTQLEQMIGRQAELTQLQATAEPLFAPPGQQASGGLVYLVGEAGVGKSRLIDALRENLADAARWLYCPADAILHKPFNAWAYGLSHYFAQQPAGSPAENQAAFERIFSELLAALPAEETAIRQELARTKSILAALLNLHWPDSLFAELGPKERYDNTLYALQNFINALSLIQPLIIVLEDAQWLDEASLDVLNTLTRTLSQYPVLLIAPLRPGEQGQPFHLPSNNLPTLTLELTAFSPAELRQLAEHKLGGPVSDTLFNILESRTGSNPFFAAQTLQYLREQGLLIEDESGWTVTQTQLELPTNLSAILVARIDRLTDRVREVIKTAAVLGREFELPLLQEVLERDVQQEITQAEANQVWHELTQLQYIFEHGLLKDAAYEMQLKARLRELHHLVGQSMEAVYRAETPGGVLAERLADVAFHYEQAEVIPKALHYLGHAADHAQLNFQNEQAANLYQRQLAQFSHQSDPDSAALAAEMDARLKLGGVLDVLARWDEAEVQYAQAETLAQQLNDDLGLGRVAQGRGDLLRKRGELSAAQTALETAEAHFNQVEHYAGLIDAARWLGVVQIMQGNVDEALAHTERSADLAREIDDQSGLAKALGNLGEMNRLIGNFEAAKTFNLQNLEIQEARGDRYGLGITNNNLGLLYRNQGDAQTAQQYFETAGNLLTELGAKALVAGTLNNLGRVQAELGQSAAAHRSFEQSSTTARTVGDQTTLADALEYQAGVYFAEGEFDSAKQAIDESVGINQAVRPKTLFEGLILQAQIDYARGETSTATATLYQMLESHESDSEQARLHYELWRLTQSPQHQKQAVALYQKLYAATPDVVFETRLMEMGAEA